MTKYADYLWRLKTTRPGELLYRVKKQYRLMRLSRSKCRNAISSQSLRMNDIYLNTSQLPELNYFPLGRVENSTHCGRHLTLNFPEKIIQQIGQDLQQSYVSKVKPAADVDIRAVWEPGRLQNIMALLNEPENRSSLACYGSPPAFAKKMLFDWLEENPFLMGPYYMSAMECGLRNIVFAYALDTLKDLGDDERKRLTDAVYCHAWWIFRNLSLYASLGNHTVCECLGLIFAGAVFQSTSEGEKWLLRGCELLDQEIDHQILADGGPAEQSTNYHRFVLDLYWLAFNFLTTNSLHDCIGWRERLMAGETFLKAFSSNENTFPAIGDSDDGYAIAPGLSPERGSRPCSRS